MRPQSGFSRILKRRIGARAGASPAPTILFVALVLLVVVGVVVFNGITADKQTKEGAINQGAINRAPTGTVGAINRAPTSPLLLVLIWVCLPVTIKWLLPLLHAH